MKIAIISASTRAQSQSRKVSDYLAARLENLKHSAEVIDLSELKLPFYGQHTKSDDAPKTLSEKLSSADGFVLVSPEWSGSLSAGLVNMFDFVGNEMAHKPVMLVGVSSGQGGAYPVSQMRQIGHKNTHFVISPENLIVRHVSNVMNDTSLDEDDEDTRVKSRAEYSLKVLVEYAQALQAVRSSGVIDFENFGSGV